MSEELIFVAEDDSEDDFDAKAWIEGIGDQKKKVEASLNACGLKGEYVIYFDPMTMDMEVTLSAYALGVLLERGEDSWRLSSD